MEYYDQEVLPPLVKQEVSKQVPSLSKETLVKSIGPYTNMQKILLVGEGDFSFSASLAVAFDSASNIIATSINSHEFLIENYGEFRTNKIGLETRGGRVIHDIDVTTMVRKPVLRGLKFDRIIFTHSGEFGRTDSDLRKHTDLVRGFLTNAKKMINEDGEIHIRNKSSSFFRKWAIPKIGSDQGLNLIQEVDFEPSIYPGYHTKRGFGGDRDFHHVPCKTFIFGLLPK